VDPDRFVLVINHREASGELPRSYAEDLLKTAAASEIPYDPAVVATSIGRGVPFVLAQPQSPVALHVAGLAEILAPGSSQGGPAETNPAGAEVASRKRRRLLGAGRGRATQPGTPG
jgi:MinD-like ATPase involved in chromosome partitioning or flagellar assembly